MSHANKQHCITNYKYIYNRYFAEIKSNTSCINLPKNLLLKILYGKEQIISRCAMKFNFVKHKHKERKILSGRDLEALEWIIDNLRNI